MSALQPHNEFPQNMSYLVSYIVIFFLLLLLRSYDHALDPESGSVDEVGGREQVLFGAQKLVRQRCPN